MNKSAALLFALLMLCGFDSGAQPVSTHKTYDEIVRGTRQISPLGDAPFGEEISNKDGALGFREVDVSVSLNSKLRMEFARRTPRIKQGYDRATHVLGVGWEMDIPYMVGTYDTRRGWDAIGTGGRCSASGGMLAPTAWVGPSPDYNTQVMPQYMYWSGIHINIPEAGYETLLKLLPNHVVPQDGAAYVGSTKNYWRVGCLPVLKNGTGEGFFVKLPNGNKYYFDWMFTRNAFDVLTSESYRNTDGDGNSPQATLVPTSDVYLFATRVEDAYGNYIDYTFDAVYKNRLTKIQSSDGAVIDIAYNTDGMVSTVSSSGRIWSYSYVAAGGYFGKMLSEVTLPDMSKWTFQGSPMWWYMVPVQLPGPFYGSNCGQNATGYRSQDTPNSGDVSVFTITHPSGAQGEFTMRSLIHGSNNTPGGCSVFGTAFNWYTGSYGVPNAYLAKSLVKRKISGPGIPTDVVWNYTYLPSWSFADNCTTGCSSKTTISKSSGVTEEYTYANSYTDKYGYLLSEKTLSGSAPIRQVDYVFSTPLSGDLGQYGSLIMGNQGVIDLYGNPDSIKVRPMVSRQATQQGRAFTWQVPSTCGGGTSPCFDNFARPTKVVKSSSP